MVTFSYVNPDATAVYLVGEMNDWQPQATPMHKGLAGSWSVTLALAPGQWVYKLVVDGVYLTDPAPQCRAARDGQGGQHSYRLVGDGDFQYHAAIPHGVVTAMSFPSQALQATADLNVYLPPVTSLTGLPVLILLHGSGMDRQQWADNGLIANYLDNLLARNQIVPFVVALPSYMAFANHDSLLDYFAADVPRFLHDQFGTADQPAQLALAGMSLGGWVTLRVGSHAPDRFGLLLPISAYYPIPISDPTGAANLRRVGRLICYCGTEDYLFRNNELLTEWLRACGVTFQYHKAAGGHTWRYWNAMTPDFLKQVAAFFQGV